MDPVGEVHVGVSGRPEQRRGSLRQPDIRVAGGIVALVALALDDHPADAVEQQRAADQVAGDVVDRAIEEAGVQPAPSREPPRSRRTSSSAALAAASCSATRAGAVPPTERLDSSHAPERSSLVVGVVEQLRVAAQLLGASARTAPCPGRAPRAPARRPRRGPRETASPCGPGGRRRRSRPRTRRRRPRRAARGRSSGPRASAPPPRGTARGCRRRRTAPPCPPGGPSSRRAAGRA